MDVKLIAGGNSPQAFSFSLPGQSAVYSTTTATNNSSPIPKDGVFSTYNGFVDGTSGTVTATMTVYGTDDPHTAGADDNILGTRNNFQIGTTNASTAITSSEGLFRPDMDGDEVYAVGVPVGTTMTYVSATSATLSANATATGSPQARFQALHWVTLGTITLTGTKHAADGFSTQAAWKWVRVVVSAISGVGATAACRQGV